MSGIAKYRTLVRTPVAGTMTTLPDPTGFTLSLDIDRRPYVMAELTFATLPTAVVNALDPRTWPLVYLSMFRDAAGLPNAGNAAYNMNQSSVRTLYCTRIVRDGDGWAMTLQSGEVRLEAIRRVAPTNWNMPSDGYNTTGKIATEMCSRAGGYLNGFVGTSVAVSSTGEAGYWQPGESAADVIDPLLEGSGLRVYAEGAQEYMVAPTGEHSGTGVTSTLIIEDAVSLQSMRRTLAVDAELGWYDSVMIRYQTTNSSGNTVTTYDRWPTNGVNTRALFLTRERAQPPGSAAKSIYQRSVRRGTTYELEMTLLPQVTPGWAVTLKDPYSGATQNGYQIKSLDFDFINGRMAVSVQAPTPEA